MIDLPERFLARMRTRLGDGFSAFLNSYNSPAARAVRVNTLKLDVQDFARVSPFPLSPVPWEPSGFYVDGEKIGKTVLHAAGAYYVQEPSAMCAAPLLNVRPGERVLDLCSAPGGKGTQLAQKMAGEGVIYLNLTGTGLGKETADDFYAEIGDTAYNRYVAQVPLTAVFVNRFTSVDITSSEQFLDIPAGESIAPYIIFRSATAMPYIESLYTVGGFWSEMILDEFMIGMGMMDGYDGPGYEWYPEFQRNCFHPVVKPLSELTQDDLFLLWVGYPGSSLRFTDIPEIKSHTFTITMTDSEGSVLTYSVPFTFPEQ